MAGRIAGVGLRIPGPPQHRPLPIHQHGTKRRIALRPGLPRLVYRFAEKVLVVEGGQMRIHGCIGFEEGGQRYCGV